MRLDVLVPTFNRADLLSRLLDSLLAAPVPPSMTVRITVIDNNCTDGTRDTVEAYMRRAAGRLRWVFEPEQGRSSALNRGIAATDGDLVAMVDDDEEVDLRWYATIASAFADPALDFIGGPYVPRWELPPPAWLPAEHGAVVGWVDGGDREVAFDAAYPGILMGGNAVVRRTTLERVGAFAPWLGRTGARLLSGEDRDFYDRLLAAGARGRYLPSLVIFHYIPSSRCTKKYFRRWMFWHGVSLGLRERHQPSPGAQLLGIPRWRFRAAVAGASRSVAGLFRSGAARAFAGDLQVWELCGLLFGRHLYRRGTPDTVDRPTLALTG